MFSRSHMYSSQLGSQAQLNTEHQTRRTAGVGGSLMKDRAIDTWRVGGRGIESNALVQRKCTSCGSGAQQVPMSNENGGNASPRDTVQRALSTPSRSLGDSERAVMESRFGRSFSDVRIHTDVESGRSARALNARAYTIGNDIVFGAGEYRPHSTDGRRLLAHELVHTVQQGGSGGRLQASLEVGSEDSPAEREADTIAQRVADGSIGEPMGMRVGVSASERGVVQRFPICLAWLFPPGKVIFDGLTDATRKDVAIIPEDATGPNDLTMNPENGVKYSCDGFWYRHSSSKSQWYKIPSHCRSEISVAGQGFIDDGCCNAAGSLYQDLRDRQSSPGWTSDAHTTKNPF